MEQYSSPHRPLAECVTTIRARLGNCLTHVELLTVAAPFCAPLLELVRDDLREALVAASEAEAVERELTRMLAGPWRPDQQSADT
jgi:hypothetical protein